MYNGGNKGVTIKLRDDDEEGKAIQEHGPICVIFDEGLFDDEVAMVAMSSEDNMN